MPSEFLTVDKLGDLDGGVARHLINDEIATAVKDLTDRGERDGKPRRVVITLELQMHQGQIVLDIRAKAKCPDVRSGLTLGEARMVPGRPNEVGFLFQTRNPENPDQPTLEDHYQEGR